MVRGDPFRGDLGAQERRVEHVEHVVSSCGQAPSVTVSCPRDVATEVEFGGWWHVDRHQQHSGDATRRSGSGVGRRSGPDVRLGGQVVQLLREQ